MLDNRRLPQFIRAHVESIYKHNVLTKWTFKLLFLLRIVRLIQYLHGARFLANHVFWRERNQKTLPALKREMLRKQVCRDC